MILCNFGLKFINLTNFGIVNKFFSNTHIFSFSVYPCIVSLVCVTIFYCYIIIIIIIIFINISISIIYVFLLLILLLMFLLLIILLF